MEHKDIFAVIIAALLVIAVIGIVGTVRNAETEKDSAGDSVVVTERPPITEKTDIWDMIHSQQAAMTTTEAVDESTDVTEPAIVTDEDGNIVTDEEGNPVTEPTETEPGDPDAPDDPDDPNTVTQASEDPVTETTTEAKRPDVPTQTKIEFTIG